MRIIFTLILVIFPLCGCMTAEKYAKRQVAFTNLTGINYPPRPKDYPISFFTSSAPSRPHDVIGKISGKTSEEVKEVMMAKARQVGGDGLIDINISRELVTRPADLKAHYDVTKGEMPVYTPGYSVTIYSFSAKVIRYK
ncbi:MAG: hypothetical protein FJZ15_03415 [Candidatus Omnitrophica bacterium]|nr:hypothetical protein [Candidatus Omnitrophota bacterium]